MSMAVNVQVISSSETVHQEAVVSLIKIIKINGIVPFWFDFFPDQESIMDI